MQYEAGDTTAVEALKFYLHWMGLFTAMDWLTATVDHRVGLILTNSEGDSLHFAGLNCGYYGLRPLYAIEILISAGFGTLSELKAVVLLEEWCCFTKPTAEEIMAEADLLEVEPAEFTGAT